MTLLSSAVHRWIVVSSDAIVNGRVLIEFVQLDRVLEGEIDWWGGRGSWPILPGKVDIRVPDCYREEVLREVAVEVGTDARIRCDLGSLEPANRQIKGGVLKVILIDEEGVGVTGG